MTDEPAPLPTDTPDDLSRHYAGDCDSSCPYCETLTALDESFWPPEIGGEGGYP